MSVSAVPEHDAALRPQLSVWQAVSVCVGMVIGAGIFKTTPLAASFVASDIALLTLWTVGGALSLAGALCFAEMSAAFPDAGGDYFFLRQAFGEKAGFLFAWSRFAVIHTGSIALLAFTFGDYLTQVIDVGPYGSAVFAATIIAVLALVNLAGLRFGMGTQVTLMMIVLIGLLSTGIAGAWLTLHDIAPKNAAAVPHMETQIGASLVFVLFAYGGWSDASTLSAEMRDRQNGIKRALILGMCIVTTMYLLVNGAFSRTRFARSRPKRCARS